jgi:hypothetical protein
VFDAFEVESVYASSDPKGTLTYDTFLRAARDEESRFEVVRRASDGLGRGTGRRVSPRTPSPRNCDSVPGGPRAVPCDWNSRGLTGDASCTVGGLVPVTCRSGRGRG